MFDRRMAIILVVLSIAAMFAVACEKQTDLTPSGDIGVLGPKSESGFQANEQLPTSFTDERCASRSVEVHPTGAALHVSFTSPGAYTDTIRPLSTATPRPGHVQTNSYVNSTGGSTACVAVGAEASLFIGGVHDVSEELLLRFTLTLPAGLELISPHTMEQGPDGEWQKVFSMPDSSSSGHENLKLSAASSGVYEVPLLSEWFYAGSMEPFEGEDANVKTLTFYVLAVE